mmetsp:Transcript_40927/g.65781  ORF Transcript_40927/g.65781 Transcript_40927/m.65781 type:complete len:81 (-) Transcript_40927:91-333(-)
MIIPFAFQSASFFYVSLLFQRKTEVTTKSNHIHSSMYSISCHLIIFLYTKIIAKKQSDVSHSFLFLFYIQNPPSSLKRFC